MCAHVNYVSFVVTAFPPHLLPPGQQVSLLAGSPTSDAGYQDGPGASALFDEPFAISWSTFQTRPVLYVADSANHAIRRIDLATKVVSTVWGGRTSAEARMTQLGIDFYDRVS